MRRRLGRSTGDDRIRDLHRERRTRAERLRDIERDALRIRRASRLTEVTRSRGQREAPFPRAFIEPAERLIDHDLANDARAGRHVSDLLREERRTILLEERGRVTVRDCIVVTFARSALAIDLSFDA